MPILSAPKQDCAVALATEKIQEGTRRHDADASILLDGQEIWITGHDERRAAFEGRGKVLVIVGIFADALERIVSSDQLSQQNHIFKPEFWIDACADVLANFRVSECPDRLFDDGWREHDLKTSSSETA